MRPYPEHIYDERRIQIAIELMQKEMRKLFPSVPKEAWPFFDKNIAGWPKGGKAYHLEATEIQDFWDIFDAVMSGIKLKPLFIAGITAANHHWERRKLNPDDIYSSTVLEQLQGLPFVKEGSNRFSYGEARKFLDANSEVKAEMRRINDEHSADPAQDAYPILCAEKEGKIVVGDGNRRTLRAVLQDKTEIEAWVATTNGEQPRDYWMPINHMMSLVRSYQFAKNSGALVNPDAYREVLRDWFTQSEVAKIAFQQRVMGQNMKYEAELTKGLDLA